MVVEEDEKARGVAVIGSAVEAEEEVVVVTFVGVEEEERGGVPRKVGGVLAAEFEVVDVGVMKVCEEGSCCEAADGVT